MPLDLCNKETKDMERSVNGGGVGGSAVKTASDGGSEAGGGSVVDEVGLLLLFVGFWKLK